MKSNTCSLAALAALTLGILPSIAQTDRYWADTDTWDTSTALWATSPGGSYNPLWTGD